MNEGAVCSQDSLASCCHCRAWRVCLTLDPVAWPGTNICPEQLGTAWGTPGHLAQLGTARGTPGHPHYLQGHQHRQPGLGNMSCHRARGSDNDSVAVPAVVPRPLGHVGPSPARTVCLGSGLRQPAAPCPMQQCFRLQSQVTMASISRAGPPAAPVLGRNCKAARVERPLPPTQPNPERTQIPPKAPNPTWLSPSFRSGPC